MRYLASLLLVGLLLPTAAKAQLMPPEKTTFRVEAGGSYTSFEDTFFSYGRLRESGKPSFTVGTHAGLPLIGDLWGEAGLRYARIAHRVVTSYSGIERPVAERVSQHSSEHVLLPIGLGYQVLGGPVYVAAHAGPNLQFASYMDSRLDYEDPSRQDEADSRTRRKLRLGTAFDGAIGTFFSAFGQKFSVEARYAHFSGTGYYGFRREMSLNVGMAF